MKKIFNVLLTILIIFSLVGCGQKVHADYSEKAIVLESGADQNGSYLIVEYENGMVEKLWNANPFYTFGIKGGSRVVVSSKENLELTNIKFGW